MPAITATRIGFGSKTVTETTLNGTDSLTYNEAANPVLILRNPTAGALTPVIDGDGATTVADYGLGRVDVSTGYSVGSIAAGGVAAIRLNTIKDYLKGAIAVNSGTGLVAQLLEF
jgi:hypothetical protein